MLSVPIGRVTLGGLSVWLWVVIRLGSLSVKNGAARLAASSRSRISAPITALGLRKVRRSRRALGDLEPPPRPLEELERLGHDNRILG